MIVKKPYTIVDLYPTCRDVDILSLKAADNATLDFDPGMFVMLIYKDPITGMEIGRAFSLASSPNSPMLDFAIAMIHGQFTSKLDVAKAGDTLYVTGPYGQFKFDPNKDKKVLFLAGGTGLAPFISMLRMIEEKKLQIDVNLVYSIKHPDEIILKDELEKYCADIGMKMTITVTREEGAESWVGEKGHIDANMISRNVTDFMERGIYVCGPLAFVKAMKTAMTSMNYPEAKISADVWGH